MTDHAISGTPDNQPAKSWWWAIGLPVLLALAGIFVATSAAKLGQAKARERALADLRLHIASVEADVARAQLQEAALAAEMQARSVPAERTEAPAHDPPSPSLGPDALRAQWDAVHKKIAPLQVELDYSRQSLAQERLSGYVRPGRHFTWWDAYRYEEIIDAGYLCHMPGDTQRVRDDAGMNDPHTGERRLKNVGWYPLYPVLGITVKFLTGLPHATVADLRSPDGLVWTVAQKGVASVDALTFVARVCCILAAIALCALVRRHFANSAALSAGGAPDPWAPHTAALWAVAFLLFAPAGIFLYANFTESLFALLLASFLLCLQRRWWWRAALLAGLAAGCRSQGVLFGPILAVCYLVRSDVRLPRRLTKAAVLGVISSVGILAYMFYLHVKFDDALAFAHVQAHGWGAGIGKDAILFGLNPLHSWQHFWHYATAAQIAWPYVREPQMWEAFCVFAAPVVLLLGRRFLSLELLLVAVVMWALPYLSTAWMVFPEDPRPPEHWVSMGRYMAVCLPLQIILGAWAVRIRWLGPVLLALAAAIFGIFCFLYGTGAWIG